MWDIGRDIQYNMRMTSSYRARRRAWMYGQEMRNMARTRETNASHNQRMAIKAAALNKKAPKTAPSFVRKDSSRNAALAEPRDTPFGRYVDIYS